MDSTFKLKRIKTFPKEIFLVLSGTFFTSASYFMVWPYLSLILYKNFNLSATKIGLILTSSAVVASIIGLISGYFSDKIGRKKIILCGSFLNALGFLLMSQAKNLELYKVSIFLCSIGTSLFGTTGKSIISDTINEGKNRELNSKARKEAAEYYLEVLFLQYNTLLFNCEKSFNEIINFRLFDEFIRPLFEGKTYDQYLIILLVRSLANVILKKVWAKLLLLRQRSIQKEENSKKQKEGHQESLLANLALSACEQIQKQVEEDLEPNHPPNTWQLIFFAGT